MSKSSSATKLDLTSTPPLNPSVSFIDFASTPLAKWYSGRFALVIEDLFSPEECQNLIALAESTKSKDGLGWQPAKIQVGPLPTDQALDTSYRFNDRILRFDHDAAGKIFERVRPFVEKDLGTITEGSKWSRIVEEDPEIGLPYDNHGTWKLVGLNERLSFLRYGPGHFFNDHLDGRLDLPDGRKSRVTIQIYLNGSDNFRGGTTRFLKPDLWYTGEDPDDREGNSPFVDVVPKTGSALIFQQRDLVHKGEAVQSGLKYALRTDFMFEQNVN